MVRKGLLLPGHNYCGPFNELDGAPPTSQLDSACMLHDQQYGDPNINTSDADNTLRQSAWQAGGASGIAVAAGMHLKQLFDRNNLSDALLRPDQQDQAPASEMDVDSSTKTGGGGVMGGGGGMAGYTPILKSMGVAPYTRCFKHRHEYTIWNKQAENWAYVSAADTTLNVGYRRGSDYFEMPDRMFCFYMSPRQFDQVTRTAVAFKVVHANWRIVDAQVYVHSLQDATLKYANYQGVSPKVYLMDDVNFQPPFKRLGVDDAESTVAEPVPSSSIGRLIENCCGAKHSNALMPRVEDLFLFERPVLVANRFTGVPNIPSANNDKSADYEYRHLNSIVAQDMLGFSRSINTWKYPIRNMRPGFSQPRGWYSEFYGQNGSHQSPAGLEYREYGRTMPLGNVDDAWCATTAYSFPVGPITEKHYVQLNPRTNSSDSSTVEEGTPPLMMKLEDIRSPDNTFQHVSVKFTIESDMCIEIYDDVNLPGSTDYFDNQGEFQNKYLMGTQRHIGSNFCNGPNVFSWGRGPDELPAPLYNSVLNNSPGFIGTGINGQKPIAQYVQNIANAITPTQISQLHD